MSRYYGGWAPYVPVAERRRKAEREMEKLRKKGTPVSPVRIEGRQIARSFWGKAWCDNLESYRDYENRLPRGRTYVRNGSVVDLQIGPNEVTAMVSGSSIYKVKVSIGEVAKARWKTLCADCAGGIESLVELLQGRFSKGVMERLCRQDTGLFPKPSEIRFTCSCPDYASMCKHIAAVLYGVGARLDEKPELLFRLRAVNETELLSDLGTALPDALGGRDGMKTLDGDDLAALFGLDMADDAADPATTRSAALAGRSGKGGKNGAAKSPVIATPPAAASVRKGAAVAPAQATSRVGPAPKAVVPAKTTAKKVAPESTLVTSWMTPAKPAAAPVWPIAAPVRRATAAVRPLAASVRPTTAVAKPVKASARSATATAAPGKAPARPIAAPARPAATPAKRTTGATSAATVASTRKGTAKAAAPPRRQSASSSVAGPTPPTKADAQRPRPSKSAALKRSMAVKAGQREGAD